MDVDDILAEIRSYRCYPPMGEKCKCGNIAELWDEMEEQDYCDDCWEELQIEKLGRRFIA